MIKKDIIKEVLKSKKVYKNGPSDGWDNIPDGQLLVFAATDSRSKDGETALLKLVLMWITLKKQTSNFWIY